MASALSPLRRLAARLRGRNLDREAFWHGTEDPRRAARALAAVAARHVARHGGRALLLGDDTPFRADLVRRLSRLHVEYDTCTADDLAELAKSREDIGIVLCCQTDAHGARSAADAVRAQPQLADVRFEYVAGLEPERRIFQALDEYAEARFVSPLMSKAVPVHEIYRDSLKRFEQKCGLRDCLDLHQCLVSVIERDVPGDIAEFGSYKGHSGYLIARLLRALKAQRDIYLFDTFERFPAEALGIDRFWSGTHAVDFDAVRARFHDLPEVHFERGDFADTLASSALGQIALAYVDCDSYRAIRFLTEALWSERLAPGGMMVFEDYGHPALLGARCAIHEFFDGRPDCVRWYSHFSGLYITMKAATHTPQQANAHE